MPSAYKWKIDILESETIFTKTSRVPRSADAADKMHNTHTAKPCCDTLVCFDTLAQIVRKELKKERDKEIRQLQARINELEAMICDIEELDERVSEIEAKLSDDE